MGHVEPVTPQITDEYVADLERAHDRFWNDPIVRASIVFKTRLDRGELTDEEADAYERELFEAESRRRRKWRAQP